ncbi:MAG: amino acid ABC transporter substrate-binding protein, partial [Phyllobacteriaceae bacterium]|nr:amino acid ABC transporter substrate-binding protein [Phyllobacteriaceae bacterium]
VQIGIGLPSNQTYLRSMLDEAIASLRTNGDLQALLEQAGLPEE